ncbi:FAD-dependent monooxygenase [Nocardia sp. 2]|uniref:FAD-dependent monooxygenase n=1 Tax=Nocardia acididurans TaxID=2802282 RepID=A0ABS1MCW2_9NOCA|nr:FAD-dependent monooxygenase [Nocardia acididurans]MBL1078500.1 FAD-dependent monooxygenase [Nocardia acididurans]
MGEPVGRAGVVGGGIGGLATTIALRAAGWDVTVYERSPVFTEVGAGITLAANALTALDVLGLGDTVRAAAIPDRPGFARNHRGRVLIDGQVSDFVGGLVTLHRADLIEILAAAVPEQCVRSGTRVTAVHADGVIETDSGTERFDLVVGADGVHSVVREQLWPGESPVRRTGITAWRWVLDTPAPAPVGVIMGRYAEAGVIPMSGGRTYVFAAAHPGFATLDHFADWPDPLPQLIAATDPARIVTDEILEIAVPQQLWKDRVVLVGDAAHAMRPTLGQGAGMALEDAVTLAACAPDPARYSATRRRRVATMSALSHHGTRMTSPGSATAAALRDAIMLATPNALLIRMFRAANRRALRGWQPPQSITAPETHAADGSA